MGSQALGVAEEISISMELRMQENSEVQSTSAAPLQGVEASSASPSGLPRISPSLDVKSRRAAEKRHAAAEWICATTGARVPHDSDKAFREALADGVVLVHLLNALRPGSCRVVERDPASPTGQVIRAFENVANFLEASKTFTTDSFSAADLEDAGDRPHVVECLLSLRDWQQAALQASGSGGSYARRSGVSPVSGTPPSGGGSAVMGYPSPSAPPAFSFTPQATELVGRHGAAGLDAADGLNYLMRSCTHMLKSRMGMPATPMPPLPSTSGTQPDIAMDAVGPVLESVLKNLTTEYERRLLAKDLEHKAQADAAQALRRQVAALQAEAAHWREAAGNAAAAAASEASEKAEELKAQERAEYERLRQAEAALLCELSSRRRELATVEADAGRRCAAAEAELAALRSEVGQYRDLHVQYKAIQEENRALYNAVQDLRGSIRVFCRVRPRAATGDDSACVVEPGEEGSLAVYSHKHAKCHEFKFDRVFREGSTQDEVYEETKPLIRSVLDGYNVCIFAYGQTGSGKTHTMSGTDPTVLEGQGINYRALGDLFALREERRGEVDYSIKVQLLEIYNEALRDLLLPEAEARKERALALNATRGSGCNVPEATQLGVESAADVAAAMALGSRNRAVAGTRMNERSSRSHQVLTVMVEGFNRVTHARTRGCLHLIDLAGSERVGRSGAKGRQLLEAQHINRSLSALGGVMAALAAKRDHVPFRDSKLTQLLQDSLAGQAKSMMFVHVAPEMSSASETISTLNFGKSVTEITLGAAKRNADSGALFEAKERAGRAEREAAAAQAALQEERRRREELQETVAALRAQHAQHGVAPIRAYRPGGFEGGGSSGGTPLSSSSAGLPRPAGVARLNLSKLGTPQRESPRAPASARASTKIPTPASASSLAREGSLTARPALGMHHKPSPLADAASGRPQIHASLAAAAAHSMLPRTRSGLSSGSSGGGAPPPLSARGARPAGSVSAGRRWA